MLFAADWADNSPVHRIVSIAPLLLAVATVLAVAPATAPSRPSVAERRKVNELSRHAADLIDRRRFSDAERTLQEALTVIPDNVTCLYNLATVHAVMKRPNDAVEDLERATDAGFTDFIRLEKNPAFASLYDLPRFQQLLSHQDQIRRHAFQRTLDDLKAGFGEHYLYDTDEPHQLVIAAHLDAPALADLKQALAAEEASEEEQIFSHPPQEIIRVIVASPVDFAKQEQRYGVAGRYDDATRTLLVKRVGPELRHEFTHALHAADQHALDQEHPVWLSEGLATMYEYAKRDAGQWIPADTPRLGRVQAAARHDTLIPLDKLLAMDRAAFTARADLAYGESGSLVLYLYEHHLLKRFYDVYTAGYANDPTGRDALAAATGMSLTQLQKAWLEWLLPRTPPADDGATR